MNNPATTFHKDIHLHNFYLINYLMSHPPLGYKWPQKYILLSGEFLSRYTIFYFQIPSIPATHLILQI